MTKLPLFLSVIFFSVLPCLADAQVKGKVTDKSDSSPLSGVTVKVKGSGTAVSTKSDGTFEITASTGAVLQFSSAGYFSINMKAASNMNVSLERNIKSLNEVVVTAMGISREERTLGYSVTSVKGDELTKARETNLVNSLAGKVSGVRVSSQSGALGSGAKIVIRGANSFSGTSQPLFIIDGMPLDNSSYGNNFPDRNFPMVGVDYGNRAGDLIPDDVESISVLKGAAATALYGSRAKNGAVVITTKKGSGKSGMCVSVNTSLRFENVLKLPSFQNEYANGLDGVYDLKYINGWGPRIFDMRTTPVKDFAGDWVILKAYPDNVKEFFETGKTLINNVNISGSNSSSDYRLSLSNTNITGVIPSSSLDKYNVNLNAGKNFTDKFSARTVINYVKTTSNGRPSQSANDMNMIMQNVYFPRTLDQEKLENNYYNAATDEQISLSTDKNANNPYWITKYNKNNSEMDRVAGNVVLSYKPVKWLTISDNIGTDFYNEFRKSFIKKGTFGQLNGGFSTADIYNNIFNNDLLFTFDNIGCEKLGVKFIAGTNFFQNTLRTTTGEANGLTVDGLYSYANADYSIFKNYYQRNRLIGLFGDVSLSYNDYLFVNITGRNDWNSTLPKENRSYFYPSVNSGFVFTELLPKSTVLSYGKLRAGWANVGGGTDSYMLDYTYTPAGDYDVQFDLNGTFPTAGGLLGYTGPDVLPNKNLKPLNQQSVEVGTDLRFFGNRIQLSATYYNTKTKNQIFGIDVPYSTGYLRKIINAGCVANNGVEIDLKTQLVKNFHNFSWNLDVNFNRNKQIVKSIDDDGLLKELTINSGFNGMVIKASVGEQFGIYGTDWNKAPNGEIIIDQTTGLRETVSDVRLGNISPDWTMGIGNTFRYKQLSLSGLIDIRQGGVIYSATASALRTTGLASETAAGRGETYIDKGVYFDGTNYLPNEVAVASMQDFWKENYSFTNTVANIFDASYIKLREIRLSYILPVGKKCFFKSAELGLEARNVLIIKSHVPHIDPEVNSFGINQVGEAVEFLNIPSTRSFGINARFSF